MSHRVDPPLYPTVKETIKHKPARSFRRDLIIAAKFSGFLLAGVVIIYIAQWLAWISFSALLGAAGWAWFKFKHQS
jgi:ABC-type transport system involved in multi-copper enzyme maturation permease subunit